MFPALLMSAIALEEASGLGTKLSDTGNPFTTKAILAEPAAVLTHAEIQPPKPCPHKHGSEPTVVPVTEQRVLTEEQITYSHMQSRA